MASQPSRKSFSNTDRMLDAKDMARLLGGADPEYDVPPPRV